MENGVTYLGAFAFANMTSLSEVTMADSVTAMGREIFNGCTALARIRFSASLTAIPEKAFCDCSRLMAIILPEGLTTIETGAFEGCYSVMQVAIPTSVTTIGGAAFYAFGTRPINYEAQSVNYAGTEAQWNRISIGEYNEQLLELPRYYQTGHTHYFGVDVASPAVTCTTEGHYHHMCVLCGEFEYWTVPATGHSPAEAILETINGVGYDTVYCTVCGEVISRVPVTDDSGKPTVRAQGSCGNQVNYVLTTDGTLTISGTGAMNNYDYFNTDNIPWYQYRSLITTLVVKQGVTQIGDAAFYDLPNLKTAILADSVRSINFSAFQRCRSLEKIKMPNNLIWLGDSVFANCSSLTSINLSGNLKEISNYTFEYCTALKSIYLPASLLYVGIEAFANCSSLQNVYFAGTRQQFQAIDIDEYYGNDDLTDATISYGVTAPAVTDPELFRFSDDTGSGAWGWASDYIYSCYQAGIISGFQNANGTYSFQPAGNLNRAQAATLIAKTFELAVPSGNTSSFNDVISSGYSWANGYIEACYQAGVISGRGNGIFDPAANVTRAELAIMVTKALKLAPVTTSSKTFADDNGQNPWNWAGSYIYACRNMGIISGYAEDGTYRPMNSITRAEAAVIMVKANNLR